MKKVFCPEPDSFSEKGLQLAAEKFELTARPMSQEDFERLAPDFDAVLVRFNTKIGPEVMKNGSKLKAILSPTTGLDHIDMQAAEQNGINVFHLKEQFTLLDTISATSELTIALMLAALRKIPQAFDDVKDGQWNVSAWRGREAAGKVLGIIGCGRLGSKVARTAQALGMDVIALDPANIELPNGVKKVDCLTTLLKDSDIISLHVHLSDKTRHMIGAEQFNLMKQGAVIINTARGAIVNSSALLDALNSGKISAAAVDVLENEHEINSKSHPLIDYAKANENLIITPHMGGATFEAVEKTDQFIINRYLQSLKA